MVFKIQAFEEIRNLTFESSISDDSELLRVEEIINF